MIDCAVDFTERPLEGTMDSRRITLLVYVGAFLIQMSCAETGLVLAPNSHLESVGK
jgi:hypothetical protein